MENNEGCRSEVENCLGFRTGKEQWRMEVGVREL